MQQSRLFIRALIAVACPVLGLLEELPYGNIVRPIYPLDPDTESYALGK